MRLLRTSPPYRLKSFFGQKCPPYAILSHTWESDEVLYEDICNDSAPLPERKLGWRKVKFACGQAKRDGFAYIWIDTCCIDKSSSSELSEAINSMFKWYQMSEICYAYIFDVLESPTVVQGDMPAPPPRSLGESRWFTRGWTLQELIAPPDVLFYDYDWVFITARQTSGPLMDAVISMTGIPRAVLCRDPWSGTLCNDVSQPGARGFVLYSTRSDHDIEKVPNLSRLGRCRRCLLVGENSLAVLDDYSTAERMSWAAFRQTTRTEDLAYCLLGLFGVSMPLLYGEHSRAFERLQEEIIKTSGDQSILAFRLHVRNSTSTEATNALLADSPARFRDSEIAKPPRRNYWLEEEGGASHMNITSRQIEIGMLLCPCTRVGLSEGVVFLGVLACSYSSDELSRPAILLTPVDRQDNSFYRIDCDVLVKISPVSLTGTFRDPSGLKSSQYRYDLRRASFENIRLVRFFDHTATSGKTVSLVTPGLKITLQDLYYISASPYAAELQTGATIQTLSGDEDTVETQTCYYIPSIKTSEFVDSSWHVDGTYGIILISGRRTVDSSPLFVIWGQGGKRSGQGPISRHAIAEGHPWCKVVQVADVLDGQWKSLPGGVSIQAAAIKFMTDLIKSRELYTHLRGVARLNESWKWYTPSSTKTAKATIAHTTFMAQPMLEMHIEAVWQQTPN